MGPTNYAECVLSEMPNVDNDVVARNVAAKCLQRFPGGLAAVGQTRSWIATFEDGQDCLIRKAANAKSTAAAQMIQGACYKLYGPPLYTVQQSAPQGRLLPYDGPVIPDDPIAGDAVESNVEYAVAAAMFSTAIAYCYGRYGPVNAGSRGGQCFDKAKDILARLDSQAAVKKASTACRAAVLRTCITPEVGEVTIRILTAFDRGQL